MAHMYLFLGVFIKPWWDQIEIESPSRLRIPDTSEGRYNHNNHTSDNHTSDIMGTDTNSRVSNRRSIRISDLCDEDKAKVCQSSCRISLIAVVSDSELRGCAC